jgi:hypothetical protein
LPALPSPEVKKTLPNLDEILKQTAKKDGAASGQPVTATNRLE